MFPLCCLHRLDCRSRNANFTRAREITVDSLRARDRRCLYRGGRFVSARCQMKNNFATLQPSTFPLTRTRFTISFPFFFFLTFTQKKQLFPPSNLSTIIISIQRPVNNANVVTAGRTYRHCNEQPGQQVNRPIDENERA